MIVLELYRREAISHRKAAELFRGIQFQGLVQQPAENPVTLRRMLTVPQIWVFMSDTPMRPLGLRGE
jgi:hypothetical protein